jgi:UDP-N-acetylglucosamine transferase subunit ALG13
MIFATIGSAEPFDRLLEALGRLDPAERLLVQCGNSERRPGNAVCVDFMAFDEIVAAVKEARVVITHAGVGSVLTCLRHGRCPVVVPRASRFGEAVDDHQLAFARRLSEQGLVVLVEDLQSLPDAIEYAAQAAVPETATSPLVAELRAFLHRAIEREPPKR